MAAVFGVAESTISQWKNKHKEFREALATGREMAAGELAGTAHLLAVGRYVQEERKLEYDKQEGRLVERVCRHKLPPSEQMLKFLLPKIAPESFAERQSIDLSAEGVQVDIRVVDEA